MKIILEATDAELQALSGPDGVAPTATLLKQALAERLSTHGVDLPTPHRGGVNGRIVYRVARLPAFTVELAAPDLNPNPIPAPAPEDEGAEA